MRIITNADDLGRSEPLNTAIFDLMSEGLVTSATLLANAPAIGDACQRLREFPRCSFGVHLNVTQFAPFTGPDGFAALLTSEGVFESSLVRQATLGMRLRRRVYEEWCAQVEALLARGAPVGHLDSHHHVHTIPALFTVLKAVQRRFGIRKVRISKNLYREGEWPSRRFQLEKRLFNAVLRGWYRTRTTDLFTDLPSYRQARRLLDGRDLTVEIMLHPGAPEYAHETVELRDLGAADPEFRRALISFADL